MQELHLPDYTHLESWSVHFMAFSIGISAKPGHGFISQLWPKRPTLGADLDLIVQVLKTLVSPAVPDGIFPGGW